MARLNEAPLPIESVEALKRRYIRQNRELARSNSVQSQRIRHLEIETSRLLGENVVLHERIIQLKAELDNDRYTYSGESVDSVKVRLDAKILELGGLVAELGFMRKPPRQSRRRTQSPKRSPDAKDWKNAQTLAEVVGRQQEGRLPTIVEDKYFPRRTLETDEIGRLSLDPANDSPDLGPPPVARFNHEDPIKFDPKPEITPEKFDSEIDDDALPAVLSINLEPRRRRRDSHGRPEIKRIHRFDPVQIEDTRAAMGLEEDVAPQAFRVSAKRKLSTRDDADQYSTLTRTNHEDFSFSRRMGSDSEQKPLKDAETTAAPAPGNRTATTTASEKTSISTQPARKVLGPKSVNTDPIISPKKTTKPTILDTQDELKKNQPVKKDRWRNRGRDRSSVITVPDYPDANLIGAKPIDVVLDPPIEATEPPDELPVVSPPNTEAPRPKQKSRDTPPPQDLDQPTTGTENDMAGGRPGRRARAAVSYAEPNLISKMRRPTKDMVDAVGREEQRSSKLQQDQIEITAATTKDPKVPMRTVVIKQEEEPESSLQSLPPAPDSELQRLEQQCSQRGHTTGSPDLQEESSKEQDSRKADHNTAQEDKQRTVEKPSGSAAAISALISANRRQKQSQYPPSRERMDKATDNLDIYDYDESSPADAAPTAAQLGKGRSMRRHSTAVASSAASAAVDGRVRASESSGRTEVEAQRRKRNVAEVGAGHERSGAAAARPWPVRTTADSVGEGSGTGGESAKRAERAAARRRSMML